MFKKKFCMLQRSKVLIRINDQKFLIKLFYSNAYYTSKKKHVLLYSKNQFGVSAVKLSFFDFLLLFFFLFFLFLFVKVSVFFFFFFFFFFFSNFFFLFFFIAMCRRFFFLGVGSKGKCFRFLFVIFTNFLLLLFVETALLFVATFRQ